MAAYQFKRLALLLSLIISTSVYAEDCSHCDGNDKLTVTTAENSIGNGNVNGDLIAKLEERIKNNANVVGAKPPLGNLQEEGHRSELCRAWSQRDWNSFSSSLKKWNYKAKDIYFDLKCDIGHYKNIPLLHVATHNPNSYKVIFQRLMRQMHKEGGNNITSCAISNLRFQNTYLLIDELDRRLTQTKDFFKNETDPAALEEYQELLKNYEKMRKKFEGHVKKFPVTDPSNCPNWV
jgi:hypothetical protein